MLKEINYVAEQFLREYAAGLEVTQPIAEPTQAFGTVIFVRHEEPRFFAGRKRDGRDFWAHSHRLALRVPSNQVDEFHWVNLQGGLPVWSEL